MRQLHSDFTTLAEAWVPFTASQHTISLNY